MIFTFFFFVYLSPQKFPSFISIFIFCSAYLNSLFDFSFYALRSQIFKISYESGWSIDWEAKLADTTTYSSMDAMESPDYPPPLVDASRPSLGFPLGTALLLLVIFTLSGIFSCCYHWDKLRSLRRRSQSPCDDLESKPPNNNDNDKGSTQQSVPVLMPGEEVPRFLALPCPCQPPRATSALQVQNHKQKPQAVDKPPRIPFPLY